METFRYIAEFTARLFAPVVPPFEVGDRVLFKGKPGTIFRQQFVNAEYVRDQTGPAYWRPCDKVRVSVRYDVTGATAGILFDPLYGYRNLQHLTK